MRLQWLRVDKVQISILVILVLVAYLNSFGGSFVSDDIGAIKNNSSNLDSINYIFHNPLFFARSILFFISFKFCGLVPFCFRIWNILFHIGVTILVFKIMPFFPVNKKVAFITASLVAVHPLLTESVSWISGGIYSQSVFFALLSFWQYLLFQKHGKYTIYACSLVSYVFALSSSEKTIVFPLILFLYEFLITKKKNGWSDILPYCVISTIWFLMLIPAVQNRFEYVHAVVNTKSIFYNPVFHIPVVIARYLILLFWPQLLLFYHSDFHVPPIQYVLYLFVFLSYIIFLFLSYTKNKFIFFWLLFFLITLIPTLNPFGLASINSERYVYFGSIGIFAVIAYCLIHYVPFKKNIIIYVVIIVSLLVRTIVRNTDWQSEERLWKVTSESNNTDTRAFNNLSNIYIEQKKYKSAEEILLKAIELDPEYAYSYHNLALIYQREKKYTKALPLYYKALNLNPAELAVVTRQNLGSIYYSLGNYPKAEFVTIEAIQREPVNAILYANLGHIYLKQNKIQLAINSFQQAIQLDPQNNLAQNGLKMIYNRIEK